MEIQPPMFRPDPELRKKYGKLIDAIKALIISEPNLSMQELIALLPIVSYDVSVMIGEKPLSSFLGQDKSKENPPPKI